MKKTAKLLSVLMAILMVLSVLPVTALAADAEQTDSEKRVALWKSNYSFMLDTVYDNTNYTSYQYVDINRKAMNQEMTAYTVLALYDNAWSNYATRQINIDNAKTLLLAIIDKADFDIDDGYVDEFVKAVEGAKDITEFVEKVAGYLKVAEDAEWLAAFNKIGKVLEVVCKVATTYQNIRDELIAAYAKVLSVRQANAAYHDFLQYVVDNATNADLKTAANELLTTMNDELKDQLFDVANNYALNVAEDAAESLISIAMDSNVYTAAAKKIYQGGSKFADIMWNTGERYGYMDALLCSYDYQALAAAWSKAALDGDDADKAVRSFAIAIAARDVSEDAIVALKQCEADGVVGKIKNKLYGTVYNDTEVNQAALNLISGVMFDDAISADKKVVNGLKIYCPVTVDITTKDNKTLTTIPDGTPTNTVNDYGAFASVYSDYSGQYHKVAFMFDNYRVKLTGTDEGYVTLVLDVFAADGTINDWSFTDVKVEKGDVIVFDTDATFYTFSKKNSAGIDKVNFNDTFVESEQKEVTAKEVVDATVEVGKEEAKSFLDKIKEFFQNLFANLFKIFKK